MYRKTSASVSVPDHNEHGCVSCFCLDMCFSANRGIDARHAHAHATNRSVRQQKTRAYETDKIVVAPHILSFFSSRHSRTAAARVAPSFPSARGLYVWFALPPFAICLPPPQTPEMKIPTALAHAGQGVVGFLSLRALSSQIYFGESSETRNKNSRALA